MRFVVRYDGDPTAEALQQIGNIVSQSSLVNWLVLEVEESNEVWIAQVPGVLDVYQEREGVWCMEGAIVARCSKCGPRAGSPIRCRCRSGSRRRSEATRLEPQRGSWTVLRS